MLTQEKLTQNTKLLGKVNLQVDGEEDVCESKVHRGVGRATIYCLFLGLQK